MVDYYTFIFILHMVYILKKINSKKIDFIKNNIYENIYGNLGVHYISLLSTFLKKLKLKM